MRSVFYCALNLALFAPFAAAATAPATPLTVILEFEGPRSESSVREMKRELQAIVDQAGWKVDWRLRDEAVGESFDNLVLVRFKGRCVLEPVGYLYDERGPLASTLVTDGAVLPFSEVACGRVTAAVRSAMIGGDYRRGDQLLGRALGRVVAHELVHMMMQSGQHARNGVTKAALSGRALIGDRLDLSNEVLSHLPDGAHK